MYEPLKICTLAGYVRGDPGKAIAEQWVDEGDPATNGARRKIAEEAAIVWLSGEYGIDRDEVEFEYVESFYHA